MSEVEKMYSNTNIKICKRKQGFALKDCTDRDCRECGYYIIPPFTAEKQLELIKWLGELDMLEIMRTTREDKAWIITSEYGMSGNVYKHTSRMKSFEEALAKLINSIWQDLTEEERKQIKEILG